MTDKPLTPADTTDLVVACPVCLRIMWRNGTCTHGKVPPPDPAAPRERSAVGRRTGHLRGGL